MVGRVSGLGGFPCKYLNLGLFKLKFQPKMSKTCKYFCKDLLQLMTGRLLMIGDAALELDALSVQNYDDDNDDDDNDDNDDL